LPAGKYFYRLRTVDLDGFILLIARLLSLKSLFQKNISLVQNYPNPFNPSTKIDYQLPVDSKVTIEIFNIKGQKISEIINKGQSAGFYSIEFGLNSIHNHWLQVFYLQDDSDNIFNGNNFTNIKKMIMLK